MTDQTTETPAVPETFAERHPGRYWLGVANDTTDPLSMIGAALCGILETITVFSEEAQANDAVDAAHDDVLRENQQLEQLHDAAQKKIDDTLAAVKKSTSKLADSVREILEPLTAPDSGAE